jgi:mevalonate kinase
MQGAALRFVRGEAPTVLASEHDLWLAVAFSGRGASTRAMVEHVAGLRRSNPPTVERFLARVEALVDSAMASLRSGNADALGQAMTENHALLAELDLSTPAIEQLLEVAYAQGARGAKLTGSGGGGSVIALGGLAPEGVSGSEAEARATTIAHAWTHLGHPAFATRIAGRPRSAP